MKKTILLMSFGLLATMMLTSCSKKGDEVAPQNPQEKTKQMLLGNWNNIWIAEDVNKNGALDESEKRFYTGTTYSDKVEFKSDGTMVEVSKSNTNTTTFTCQYEISADGKSIIFTVDGKKSSSVIELLNDSELKIKAESDPLAWSYSQKIK